MNLSNSMTTDRSFPAIVGVFAAALFLALAICISGLVSLATDTDVLVENNVGPLVAPLMFAVATASIFALVGTVGSRRPHRVALPAVGIGLCAYVLFLVSGAVADILLTGRLILGIFFIGANALRPYALSLAAIGVVVAFCALLLLSIRNEGGADDPPRWPWERREPPEG